MSASSSSAIAREARLGVAHGGRRVAVDGAEVALAVDERVAHGEGLREAHHRLVDGGVAVRVVLTEDLTDDAWRSSCTAESGVRPISCMA